MVVYIEGLALKNYRGFGPDKQYMGFFKDFNIFIGTNNSGKSAVLSFLSAYLGSGLSYRQSSHLAGGYLSIQFKSMDIHKQGGQGDVNASFCVSRKTFIENISNIPSMSIDLVRLHPFLERIADNISDEVGRIWINLCFNSQLEPSFDLSMSSKQAETSLNDSEWNFLWRSMTGQNGGSARYNWIPETLNNILSAQIKKFQSVVLIPAIRQIGPKGEAFDDHSGKGLIDRLAEIQNPDLAMSSDRDLFDKINGFMQNVTGDSKANINIPHNRENILVDMGSNRFPLASLGTGIHEVIIIASVCTLNSDKIICIEEPEIHLHPLLQRKLIRYLSENTDCQYFIATHSPSFIDFPLSATFHVTHDQKQTYVKETVLRKDRFAICTDLGHRASDIVQSNYVIWVEGPSDRLYVVHWLAAIAPELVENIHFSVMFYGGRLLSHLSATTEVIDEFIDLRSLNQNLAILIDSDRRSKNDDINDTKKRIFSAFSSENELAWVTSGREVENYIDYDVLQSAIKRAHPKLYGSPATAGQFKTALAFKKKLDVGDKEVIISDGIDKIKVARFVCEVDANLDILDLRKNIEKLAMFVKRCNE